MMCGPRAWISRVVAFSAAIGAAAAVPVLAACGGDSGGQRRAAAARPSSSGTCPGAATDYNPAAQKLVGTYVPTGSNLKATYQTIQWANFTQTFSSAIASNTGPAVSTGGGFQAFQYAQQGAIAYADNLIATMKKDGTYDDFIEGQVEAMKTAKGYAAVPWQLDIRVWWYNKKTFAKLGLTPPTSWDEMMTSARRWPPRGYYGFAAGAGAGNNLGAHAMVMMMINNGGGLFDPSGKVAVDTPANLAGDAVRQRAGQGQDHRPALGELHRRQPERPVEEPASSPWASTPPGLDGNIGDTAG